MEWKSRADALDQLALFRQHEEVSLTTRASSFSRKGRRRGPFSSVRSGATSSARPVHVQVEPRQPAPAQPGSPSSCAFIALTTGAQAAVTRSPCSLCPAAPLGDEKWLPSSRCQADSMPSFTCARPAMMGHALYRSSVSPQHAPPGLWDLPHD